MGLLWYLFLNKTVAQLATFINDQYPESRPLSAPSLALCCGFEMERMESSTHSLLEANLYSLWPLSGLLSQLKRDGSAPSDPVLFNLAISSLSGYLLGQTRMAASLIDFLVSKRREGYLGHTSLPLSAAQKRDLLVSPSSDFPVRPGSLGKGFQPGQGGHLHIVLLVHGQAGSLASVRQGEIFIVL